MAKALDPTRYTSKFTAYPADFLAVCAGAAIKLPKINTLKGQAIALMAQPEVRGVRYVSRPEATIFFQQIGMKTADSIQPFNKDLGIVRETARGEYYFKYPFVVNTTHLDKRKGVKVSGDKTSLIGRIKDFFRTNIVEVPDEKWQIGHLDPTIGDASEKNLAWQPPIQGKYRDRFKFCPDFMKMWPTTKELLPKFKEYYTEDEQREIYEHLKKKFESDKS